ncbi:hypothetical protein BH20ACI2_BH20ACI2_17380 [soil metagenome]
MSDVKVYRERFIENPLSSKYSDGASKWDNISLTDVSNSMRSPLSFSLRPTRAA